MKKVFALVLTVLMAVSVFAGCKPSEGSGSTVIKVGTSGPLTGDYAVYGVAVANGLEPVKEAADEICGNNDEDGVAHWLASNIE